MVDGSTHEGVLCWKQHIHANTAGGGGGLYATANSTLKLGGVNTFRANRGLVSGGQIWLDNSNLTLYGFTRSGEIRRKNGGAKTA